MRSVLLLAWSLACVCFSRRVQPLAHEDSAQTLQSDNQDLRHAGAIEDADRGMTSSQQAPHDLPLHVGQPEGSSDGSLANLLLALSPTSAHAALARTASAISRGGSGAVMRKRFEDAEDKRLSKGGSGGGIGTRAKGPVDSYAGLTESQRARAEKVEAYLDNDLEAADPLFGKIIAGCMLVVLLGGLIAIFLYYGADGLASATYTQRSIRGA